jgi:hypothetical protein
MIKRYGDQALKESAARATTLTLAGDDDGAATWHRIMAAVTELANKTPPGRVPGWHCVQQRLAAGLPILKVSACRIQVSSSLRGGGISCLVRGTTPT